MSSELVLTGFFYSNALFFFVALAVCAFFSFMETSISSVRTFKIKELRNKTNRYKKLLQVMQDDPNKILSLILIAKNIADVTTAMLSGYIVDNLSMHLHLSENVTFFLSIVVATLAILIFGEIIPKSIGKLSGERFLESTLWVIHILYYLLYPLSFVAKFGHFIAKKINNNFGHEVSPLDTEKELQYFIEHVQETGTVEPEKITMLMNIFWLGQKTVKEIMVPKNNIVAISSDISLKEALGVFSSFQLTRLPVYTGHFDNMIGMLHQKDVFSVLLKKGDYACTDIVRPLMYVPEYMHLNQLLTEFKSQHAHLAIVINEFGSIDGLVTVEDVLQEIVGEMHDEHGGAAPKLLQIKPGAWLVDASINLHKTSSLLDISFDQSPASTLGGFLIGFAQRLPKKGDVIEYKSHQFHIKKATEKQILQILIVSSTATLPLHDHNSQNRFHPLAERTQWPESEL